MGSFEEHLENIKNLTGFQFYKIIEWDSYSCTVEYWVDSEKTTKVIADDGSGNWIEM